MIEADVIVGGGGSAGAVMAARLSEDARRKVVLIEAGQDTPPGHVPPDIRDTFPTSFFNRDYFWPDQTAAMRSGEPQRPFMQPRVMGGGSSVMGMIALWGVPSDYDRWEAMGARHWGWRDVESAFRALTNDLDREPRQRNQAGSTSVRRLSREGLPLFMRRIAAAATARGLAELSDVYETSGDGFFALPLAHDTERATTARCYLDAAARARPNLRIIARARVDRVLFEGRRVRGVVVARSDHTQEIAAPEVVVCAGAINSPALLLRSGIGPAAELRALGVAPLIDRPGVGRNYQNHPLLHFALTLAPESRLRPDQRHYAMTGIRLSSGLAGCPAGDLFIYLIGRVSPRGFGTRMGMVAVALLSPFSRGSVRLVSPDPAAAPIVEQCLLSDPRDVDRMVIAARFAEGLLCDAAVRGCYHEAYLLPREAPLRLINGTGAVGEIKALGATAVLAAPGPLRRAVLARAMAPGRLVVDAGGHQPLTDAEIAAASGTMFHPSGTCRMGEANDPDTVVDPACGVLGVEGLRVVDASVMPCLPSANTNVPTIMIAERVAEMMRLRVPI